ncbi:hypothetical protein NP493_4891g00000 [Ridgeia piscesae]|uniref:Uncharacterized protein n=1 Tax=Ridgeia piscesae TaxID=27915 RepID=A0AAD9MQP7_RIDPI|nr:hypothetical protein NP493_4891g00000 [Ridgeia piscesae]
MDTRHYSQRTTDVSTFVLNRRTLPGVVLLILGMLFVLAGIMLMIAFGLPRDVLAHPKRIIGTAVIALGGVFGLAGVVYAVTTNGRSKNSRHMLNEASHTADERRQLMRKQWRLVTVVP